LRPLIEKVADGRAEIVEPSRAVALRAKRVLEDRGLANSGGDEAKHVFISTKRGDSR
jgi:glutamate racemase